MKRLRLALFWVIGAVSAPVFAAGATLDSLRAQDQRLLSIAEPVLAGNAQLCDRTMPDLGVALQSIDQYPADNHPGFAAPVAFAAVLPDSPAALAGIVRDDGLVSIDGIPVAKRPDLAKAPLRDSAFAALAAHDPARALELGVMHAGEARSVTIAAKPECRAMVEIVDENGDIARSDGATIQIGYGLAARASDEQLAVIFAHELAHSILHHRERLEAAGANNGFFGQVGRSRKLNLEAEKDADRLSVYLLANAGIDPHAAPAFWRSTFGRRLSGGIFHNQAHPSAKTRAQLMDAEISAHSQGGALGLPTELLASRTQPLTGSYRGARSGAALMSM
jgi:hypothetical protein